MDKGVFYSKNGQVSVFFSVELIDILSQVQPADVDGDIDKFDWFQCLCHTEYDYMQEYFTLNRNVHQHQTRSVFNCNYFVPRVNTFGRSSFYYTYYNINME